LHEDDFRQQSFGNWPREVSFSLPMGFATEKRVCHDLSWRTT
jgi:hypothetical protein